MQPPNSVHTPTPTETVPTGPLAGRVLGGRYQLLELIGSGGMGEIYRARRTHIGDLVAVKVLRAEVVKNEKMRQRFYREARAAALLSHPNAVVIHDFGEEPEPAGNSIAYIVMELLVGRNLRQLLSEQGPLHLGRAYILVRQACAALEAGHRAGIIHRDIKPDNIFLLDATDETDHIKLLDFGIAKLQDTDNDSLAQENNLTNAGTIIGTPNYMSPEQCKGESADARSDIYSLGVVIYEMLTGQMPFIAKTATGVAIKHVTEAPRPPRELRPELPPELDAVILQTLAKIPADRPQTMLDLARVYTQAMRIAGTTSGLGHPTDAMRPPTTASSLRLRLDTPHTSEGQPRIELAEDGVTAPFAEVGTNTYDTMLSETSNLPITDGQSDENHHRRGGTVLINDAPDHSPQRYATNIEIPIAPVTELAASPAADISEASPTVSFHDDYATMVPEAPDAPARPNPFAVQAEAVSQHADTTETPAPRSAASSQDIASATVTHPTGALPLPNEAAELVIEVPAASETAHARTGKSAGSRFALLTGIAAVVLVGGLLAWNFLTDERATQSPAATPTPALSAQTGSQPGTGVPRPAPTVAPEGMVLIPGGSFTLGRKEGEENERPPHEIILAPFYLDRTEVTNAQYARFLEATGYLRPPSWKGKRNPEGTDQLPVTDITWEDASEYAKWAGKRLPTEAEWEFAARGLDNFIYPWGNEWRPVSANVDNGPRGALMPVGTYAGGVSPFGIQDLIGNAWEWTASHYEAYPGGTLIEAKGYENLKVIRGCSFGCKQQQATATFRRGWPAKRSDWPEGVTPDYTQTGFRCAQDAPQN